MSEKSHEIFAPVAWLPAGLISWYAPGGAPVALVTSWVALIGGMNPRMRTAWHGNQDAASRFWAGGDFVYNIPDEASLREIRRMIQYGQLCLHAENDLKYDCMSGIASVAPRLINCRVQIECVNGKLIDSGGEIELCGDVVRLHRDQVVIVPGQIPDLCAIEPLGLPQNA